MPLLVVCIPKLLPLCDLGWKRLHPCSALVGFVALEWKRIMPLANCCPFTSGIDHKSPIHPIYRLYSSYPSTVHPSHLSLSSLLLIQSPFIRYIAIIALAHPSPFIRYIAIIALAHPQPIRRIYRSHPSCPITVHSPDLSLLSLLPIQVHSLDLSLISLLSCLSLHQNRLATPNPHIPHPLQCHLPIRFTFHLRIRMDFGKMAAE